jgi:hypothetical protein
MESKPMEKSETQSPNYKSKQSTRKNKKKINHCLYSTTSKVKKVNRGLWFAKLGEESALVEHILNKDREDVDVEIKLVKI